jgi:peptide chain release factor subunit 1
MDSHGFPVISVYVNLQPGPQSLRTVPAQIKDLLANMEASAESLSRAERLSVRADITALSNDVGRFGEGLGHGVAIFRSNGAGIDQQLVLPGPVRERAVVDSVAYLRPLDAMLEQYQRYCVAVVGRSFASIFRFSMDELETWEEMRDEEIRKANYGGFAGYEEQRVRARADEVASRHYRAVAGRLTELKRTDGGFDLLILGGSSVHVEGTIEALPPDVAALVAGTFTIDPGTMTPATVRDQARRVAADWEAHDDQQVIADLLDAASSGGRAVLGLDEVCSVVNQRAVATLFVQAGGTTPGTVCTGCGRVSRDDSPVCAVCGKQTRRVPDVIDRLSESVRAAGGQVRHILSPGPLGEHEVGAQLRYSTLMIDPT